MAVSKKTQDSISVSSSGSTTSSHLDRAAEIRRDQKHVDEQKAKEITERAGIRSQNAVDTRSKTINAAAEFAVGHNEHVDEVLANFRAGNLPTPDKSTPMFRRGSGSKSPKGKGESHLDQATRDISQGALIEMAETSSALSNDEVVIQQRMVGAEDEYEQVFEDDEVIQKIDKEQVVIPNEKPVPKISQIEEKDANGDQIIQEYDDEEFEEYAEVAQPNVVQNPTLLGEREEGLSQQISQSLTSELGVKARDGEEENDDEIEEILDPVEEYSDELQQQRQLDEQQKAAKDKELEDAKRSEMVSRKLYSETAEIAPIQRALTKDERMLRNEKMQKMEVVKEGEEDEVEKLESVVNKSQQERTSLFPPISQSANRTGFDPLRTENYDDQEEAEELIDQFKEGIDRVDIPKEQDADEEERDLNALNKSQSSLLRESSDDMDEESTEIVDELSESLTRSPSFEQDDDMSIPENDLIMEDVVDLNPNEAELQQQRQLELEAQQKAAKDKELEEAAKRSEITQQVAGSFASSMFGNAMGNVVDREFTLEKIAARNNTVKQEGEQKEGSGLSELDEVAQEMASRELYTEVNKALQEKLSNEERIAKNKEERALRNEKMQGMGIIEEGEEDEIEEQDEEIDDILPAPKPSEIYKGINDVLSNEEFDLETKQLEIAKLASQVQDNNSLQIYAIATSSIISHEGSEDKDKEHSLERLQEEFSFLENDEQDPQEREESLKAASDNLQADGDIIDGHKEIIAGAFNTVLKSQEIEKQQEEEKKKAKQNQTNQDNQLSNNTSGEPSDASKEADEFKKYCDELLKKYGDRYKLDLKSSGLQIARVLATVAIAAAIPGVGAVLAGAFFMATKNHAKDEKLPDGRNTELEEAMNMLKGADIKTAEAQKMLDGVKNGKAKGEEKSRSNPPKGMGSDSSELEGIVGGLTGNITSGGRGGSTSTRSVTKQQEEKDHHI